MSIKRIRSGIIYLTSIAKSISFNDGAALCRHYKQLLNGNNDVTRLNRLSYICAWLYDQGYCAKIFLLLASLIFIGCNSVTTTSILSRGGYYQDDGPENHPPTGLEETPDAVPVLTTYVKAANRPYQVFGKRYAPHTNDRVFRQRGMASWYGKKFHKQLTSSGEPYDMYQMTAAHPTLPIPSYVRVTNVKNSKQVIVRVNDRGPFHAQRIIDLSYVAALKLGFVHDGKSEVIVERILPSEIQAKSGKMMASKANASQDPAPNGNFRLQFGAYAQAENAEKARLALLSKVADMVSHVDIVTINGLHCLVSSPFDTRQAAAFTLQQVMQKGGVMGWILAPSSAQFH